MTKTEQAALQELGMDEAALAERTARAEAMARGETHTPIMTMAEIMEAEIREDMKPPRKKRSDAGIPKEPKIAQKPGLLDSVQVARLRDLIDTQETCRIELESAISGVEFRQGRFDYAQKELQDYLFELEGK